MSAITRENMKMYMCMCMTMRSRDCCFVRRGMVRM